MINEPRRHGVATASSLDRGRMGASEIRHRARYLISSDGASGTLTLKYLSEAGNLGESDNLFC